jgi:regulatory protein
MKITAIKQQIKRADRYSVCVDGKYAASFSEGERLRLGLRVGQELTASDLKNLKDDSARDKAYLRAIDLISRRPRSEWEIRDYLGRKGYGPAIMDKTLSRLTLSKLVNDLEFARWWVESRRLLRSASKRRLRQKRVADDVIDQALAEDETDERALLRELAQRKRKQSSYKDDLKLMRLLSRRGFDYDDIKSVLQEIKHKPASRSKAD